MEKLDNPRATRNTAPVPAHAKRMDPLWIMFLGMVVVLGGILAPRLHAFLARVTGALAGAA